MDVISRSTAAALGWALAGVLAVSGASAQQKPAEAASAANKAPNNASSKAVNKAAKKAPKKAPARPAPVAPPDWNAQLASCKNEAGMNLVKREKCVYAHCKGHWGQGECPPGQDMPTKDSFKNPFKRGS